MNVLAVHLYIFGGLERIGYGWRWVPEWIVQVALLRSPFEIVLPVLIVVVSMLWLGLRAVTRPRLAPSPAVQMRLIQVR